MDLTQILNEVYDKFVFDYRGVVLANFEINIDKEENLITLDFTDIDECGYLVTLKATIGKPYYFYMGDLVFWDLKLSRRFKNRGRKGNSVYNKTITHSRLLDPENAGESLINVMDWIRIELSAWLDSFIRTNQYTVPANISSLNNKVNKFIADEGSKLNSIVCLIRNECPKGLGGEDLLAKLFPYANYLTTFAYNYYIVEYDEEGERSIKLARIVTLPLPEGNWLDSGVSRKVSIIIPSEKKDEIVYSTVTLRQDDSYGYPIRTDITKPMKYITLKDTIREEYILGVTEIAEKMGSLDYLDKIIDEIS